MRRFRVRFTEEAEQDLLRLYEFLVAANLDAAERALDQIRHAIELLKFTPSSCRRARPDLANLRELVIPFGKTGYVALFEIEPPRTVTILAVRHQREDDC
jgi:plasmid stabilization system protein ParE